MFIDIVVLTWKTRKAYDEYKFINVTQDDKRPQKATKGHKRPQKVKKTTIGQTMVHNDEQASQGKTE